jgi:hypothetical protein
MPRKSPLDKALLRSLLELKLKKQGACTQKELCEKKILSLKKINALFP